MRYAKYSNHQPRHQNRRAAIFVDYEDLYASLSERLDNRSHPDDLIVEVIDELRRYLLEELRTPTNLTTAYADFSSLSNGSFIQRTLVLQDVDPRFAPTSVQANATEIQLCAETMDVLHQREDITTFAIVTGGRAYLPLLQQLKRYGRTALLVTLEAHRSTDALSFMGEEVFVDAYNLFSEPSRKLLLGDKVPSAVRNGAAPREPRENIAYRTVTNSAARQTLEIIEEHFGQYEEVYLTPLLRKLSELLGDEEHDPKSIINDLEDAGAVWLEKRRGFPYDYTVLIVDTEHPDVQLIRQEYYEQKGAEPDVFPDDEPQDPYYYDDYEDPVYSEEGEYVAPEAPDDIDYPEPEAREIDHD